MTAAAPPRRKPPRRPRQPVFSGLAELLEDDGDVYPDALPETADGVFLEQLDVVVSKDGEARNPDMLAWRKFLLDTGSDDLGAVLEAWAGRLERCQPAGYRGRRPPAAATRALPGTSDKLTVLAERAARGEALWHEDDACAVADDRLGVTLRYSRGGHCRPEGSYYQDGLTGPYPHDE